MNISFNKTEEAIMTYALDRVQYQILSVVEPFPISDIVQQHRTEDELFTVNNMLAEVSWLES
jgi:hypothetical protein